MVRITYTVTYDVDGGSVPASTPENSTMLYIGIGAAAAAILGAVAFFIIRRR